MATDVRIKRLWKISKIIGVPIFSEKLKEYNEYDLELIEWLEVFEDPEAQRRWEATFYDDDFNEYFNSKDFIPADPNMTKEEELAYLEEVKKQREEEKQKQADLEEQEYLASIHDEWEEI